MQRSGIRTCSFCGKTEDRVRRLINGITPTIFICDECVELCRQIIEEGETRDAEQPVQDSE